MVGIWDLKRDALKGLRLDFWSSLFVTMIWIFLAGGAVASVASYTLFGLLQNFVLESSPALLLISAIVFQFFVSGPISVGRACFFLQSIDGNANIKSIFFAFHTRDYWSIAFKRFVVDIIVLSLFILPIWYVFFVTNIETFAGQIIFVGFLLIPAFLVLYRFRLTSYMLAKNPKATFREIFSYAGKWSRYRERDVEGIKINAFKIDASFLGWYILAPLAFGIGVFFVMVYHEATMARYFCEIEKTLDTRRENATYELLSDSRAQNFVEGEYRYD